MSSDHLVHRLGQPASSSIIASSAVRLLWLALNAAH
jgi:hypothetical protein